MQIRQHILKSGPEWGSIWQKEAEGQWETRREGMQSLGKLAGWHSIAESQAPMHTAHLGSRNPNFPPEEEDKEEKGKEPMKCESTRQHQEARLDMLLILCGIILAPRKINVLLWITTNWHAVNRDWFPSECHICCCSVFKVNSFPISQFWVISITQFSITISQFVGKHQGSIAPRRCAPDEGKSHRSHVQELLTKERCGPSFLKILRYLFRCMTEPLSQARLSKSHEYFREIKAESG